MKLRTFLALSAVLATSVAHAQLTVVSTNLSQDPVTLPGVLTSAGEVIATGNGFVAVGTFTISDVAIQDLFSAGNVTAILEAWVQHGSAGVVNGLGGGIDGAFQVDPQANTPAAGLGNKPVYTVITNTSSPTALSEFIIFRHNSVFPVVEAPTVGDLTVLMNPANGSLIVGGFGNFQTNAIGVGAEDAYNTAAIPEPSTYALLGLGALAGFVAYRRRR